MHPNARFQFLISAHASPGWKNANLEEAAAKNQELSEMRAQDVLSALGDYGDEEVIRDGKTWRFRSQTEAFAEAVGAHIETLVRVDVTGWL